MALEQAILDSAVDIPAIVIKSEEAAYEDGPELSKRSYYSLMGWIGWRGCRNVATVFLWVTSHYVMSIVCVPATHPGPVRVHPWCCLGVLHLWRRSDLSLRTLQYHQEWKEKDRETGRTGFETQFHVIYRLMFCAVEVHLYDKQASVFLAFGIFWVKFLPHSFNLFPLYKRMLLCTVASAVVASYSYHCRKQSYVSRVFGCYNCKTIFYYAANFMNSVLE